MLLQINIEKLRSTQHSVCIHLLLIRLKPTLVLKILFFFSPGENYRNTFAHYYLKGFLVIF